jgi:hypothetical protein
VKILILWHNIIMSKVSCIPNLLKYHFCQAKTNFSMFFWLNIPQDMKLGVWTGFRQGQGFVHRFYSNSFSTRVPMLIHPSHALEFDLIKTPQSRARLIHNLQSIILCRHIQSQPHIKIQSQYNIHISSKLCKHSA